MSVNSVNVQNTQGVSQTGAGANGEKVSQGGDFAQLIMELVSNGKNTGNNTLELLSEAFRSEGDDDENNTCDPVLSQLIEQLVSMQTTGFTNSVQTSEMNTTGFVTTGLENSSLKNMETVLQLQQLVTGSQIDETSDFSRIASLFGKDGTLNEDIFSSVSVNPYEVLLELTNNKNLTLAENFEENFTVGENDRLPDELKLLKNAIKSGEAEISKDTQMADIIGKMSEDYRIAAGAKNVKSSANKNNGDTADTADTRISENEKNQTENSKETAVNGGEVIDYTKSTQAPQQVKTDGTAEENAVYNQTLDSISRMMKEGKESYTARLNPEGLGEIVIKMAKDESGIVINIVVSSARTAEILNSHLGSLQANLSDINPQINRTEVASVQNVQENSQYQGFDFNGQNFDRQDRQFFEENQRQYYHYPDNSEEDLTEKTGAKPVDGKINTYI